MPITRLHLLPSAHCPPALRVISPSPRDSSSEHKQGGAARQSQRGLDTQPGASSKKPASSPCCLPILTRSFRDTSEAFEMILRLLIVSFLLPIAVQSQNGKDDQEECVRLWLKKRPDLNRRFKINQVKWLCQRTDEWIVAASMPTRPVADFITPKQFEYLTKLKCQGDECLKEFKYPKPRPERPRPPPWVPAVIGGRRPTTSPPEPPTTFDPFDQIADSSILGEDPTECAERFWLAQTCKLIVNSTSAEEIFPEEFHDKTVPADVRSRLQLRYDARKVKCLRIKKLVNDKNRTLDDFPNCRNQTVFLTPKQLAEKCQEILEFEKARRTSAATAIAQSAWNFVKKLIGKTNEKEIAPGKGGDYGEWLNRCRRARDRLQANGLTFQSWITQWAQKLLGAGKRRRRQAPTGQGLSDLLGDNTDGSDQRAKRKEYRMLSDDERNRYHAAINKLKTEKIDTLSKYDLLVVWHTPQEASGAHWGPAFLAFHREFLKQYEVALRKVDATIALPYWDTTLDEGLPTPADSIIWTKEFLGTRDGPVVEGPFANWIATQELSTMPGVRQLYRNVGTSPFGGLYKQSDIDFIMTREKYDDLTACVDPTFELVHGIVHMFVGGYMADIGIAPNDPAFFMHHNFIDYVWEEFRQNKQTPQQRETDYPTDDKACNNFHFAEAPMKPFDAVRNKDGLSNNYTKDLYYYQPRPRCSEPNPQCGSPYLWCEKTAWRCLSKVQVGGNCTGYEATEICYQSTCMGGVCKPDPMVSTTSTAAPVVTTTTPVVTTVATPVPTTVGTTVATSTKAPITTPMVPPAATTARVTTMKPTVAPTLAPTTTAKATTPIAVKTTTTGRPTTAAIPVTVRPTPAVTTVRPVITTPTVPSTGLTTRRPPNPVTSVVELPPPYSWTQSPSGTLAPSTSGPKPPFLVAYIPIAVFRSLSNSPQPVRNARVTSTGLGSPAVYTQTLTATPTANYAYPSYPGAYLLPVYDPSSVGSSNGVVQFSLAAVDADGKPCTLKCYNQASKTYGPCSQGNRFKIATNPQFSDPIVFGLNSKQALEKQWVYDRGGVQKCRTKVPDYILFECP